MAEVWILCIPRSIRANSTEYDTIHAQHVCTDRSDAVQNYVPASTEAITYIRKSLLSCKTIYSDN